ncbi:hypothetical protein BDV28DRAFT_77698 [Aspergillus coremiiformis]|uniref:Uncharacterized protein n=1 Tax=Aspergillus coremiiformis TaxID=138285 RepID=A0A5N6YWL3_9EURO|nr:hypothetical protein BDV28DRAFT_77698 [Aspergillus coremiiformis]
MDIVGYGGHIGAFHSINFQLYHCFLLDTITECHKLPFFMILASFLRQPPAPGFFFTSRTVPFQFVSSQNLISKPTTQQALVYRTWFYVLSAGSVASLVRLCLSSLLTCRPLSRIRKPSSTSSHPRIHAVIPSRSASVSFSLRSSGLCFIHDFALFCREPPGLLTARSGFSCQPLTQASSPRTVP